MFFSIWVSHTKRGARSLSLFNIKSQIQAFEPTLEINIGPKEDIMNILSTALVTLSLALAIAGGLLVPNNMLKGLSYLILASVVGIVSMVVAVLTMED